MHTPFMPAILAQAHSMSARHSHEDLRPTLSVSLEGRELSDGRNKGALGSRLIEANANHFSDTDLYCEQDMIIPRTHVGFRSTKASLAINGRGTSDVIGQAMLRKTITSGISRQTVARIVALKCVCRRTRCDYMQVNAGLQAR
ncbi:hypothetical protein CHU98_g1184 [Xylaria longipes]|nr:hypothetical protein CHU98_g1184 [Xylaria longipes]